mgnify:CR=1 FL=1
MLDGVAIMVAAKEQLLREIGSIHSILFFPKPMLTYLSFIKPNQHWIQPEASMPEQPINNLPDGPQDGGESTPAHNDRIDQHEKIQLAITGMT